jgi:hypothetical protein
MRDHLAACCGKIEFAVVTWISNYFGHILVKRYFKTVV